MEVVIEWSDTNMLFIEQHKYLEFAEVGDRLRTENISHWKSFFQAVYTHNSIN